MENLQESLKEKVDKLFPEKTVKVSTKDKPFITKELKSLDRRKKKEWRKNGKSSKYNELKHEFLTKYKKASAAYLQKNVTNLKKENQGKAFATIKSMGAQLGDCEEVHSFTLRKHVEENLTAEEQLKRISDHFVDLSNQFEPLEINQLSEETQEKIRNVDSNIL